MIIGILIGFCALIIVIGVVYWICNKNKKYNKGNEHYIKVKENIDIKNRINSILKSTKYKTDFDEIYFNYTFQDIVHQNAILYKELNNLLLKNSYNIEKTSFAQTDKTHNIDNNLITDYNSSDIQKLLNLNYEECCEYLKNKYGNVKGNYFTNESCKISNRSIKRGREGLYIHHIDEDKAIRLSEHEYAINNPFSYQLANRLVYCNLLEHLVLHIKIMQYPHEDQNINEEVGIGGVFAYMIPELNDIYSGIKYNLEWKKKVVSLIIDLKDDYFKCLKFLMKIKPNIPLIWFKTSFNELYGDWKKEKNKDIYNEIERIYNEIINFN